MSRPTAGPALRLERTFAAPAEVVFDAWTEPEVLRRWWAARPDWECASADVDLRVGGRYRLSMRDPSDGSVRTVGGEYVEIARPRRLVYTWTWLAASDAMAGSEDTLVTVEFRDLGGRTAVAITHERFADERVRDLHVLGWEGCLDSLADRVFVVEREGEADR
jgi:uncharacterized protein YndB with AHSA1/START domain